MKKLISVLLALISVICITFAFAACGDNEAAEKGNVSPVTDANQNSGNDKKLEEGKFYTVTEAYESGYLTREDVMTIAYYHNGGNHGNEDAMDENYTPLPKTPEELSSETEEEVKQTYFNTYWKDQDLFHTEEVLGEKLKIYIDEYVGMYGDCIVIMMSDNYSGFWDVIKLETVDNIKIYYSDSNKLKIWIKTK